MTTESELERLRRLKEACAPLARGHYGRCNDTGCVTIAEDDYRRICAALTNAPEVIEAGGVLFVKTGERRVLARGEAGLGGFGTVMLWENPDVPSSLEYDVLKPVLHMREAVGLLRDVMGLVSYDLPMGLKVRIKDFLSTTPELPGVE